MYCFVSGFHSLRTSTSQTLHFKSANRSSNVLSPLRIFSKLPANFLLDFHLLFPPLISGIAALAYPRRVYNWKKRFFPAFMFFAAFITKPAFLIISITSVAYLSRLFSAAFARYIWWFVFSHYFYRIRCVFTFSFPQKLHLPLDIFAISSPCFNFKYPIHSEGAFVLPLVAVCTHAGVLFVHVLHFANFKRLYSSLAFLVAAF